MRKIISVNTPSKIYFVGTCHRYFSRLQDMFRNLVKINPKPGDIIFIFIENFIPPRLPFFDISKAFDSYDYIDIWITEGHVNEKGYEILAKNFFELLIKNNFFKDIDFNYPLPPVHR